MGEETENLQVSLMKATQVAKYLNISKAMTYRLMQNGVIPTVKIGRTKRVRPNDLQKFIMKNMTPSDCYDV